MHDPLQENDSSSLQQLCKELQLTFTASFMHYPLITQKKAIIPYAFAKSKRILPLMEKEGTLWVGLDDPFNLEAVEEIALLRGQIITEVISTEEALDAAIESVFSQKKKRRLFSLKR